MKISVLIGITLLLTHFGQAQKIERYDRFEDFEASLVTSPDQIYVVNFWATWCGPCIKELPFFESLHANDSEVEVVLVSIDFKNQFEKRLQPFVENRGLQSRVIHMADPNANVWIDKVDPSWSGAIPATIFIKDGKRYFFEKEFPSQEALNEQLEKIKAL